MPFLDRSYFAARRSYHLARWAIGLRAEHQYFLLERYERLLGKKLNLENPRTLIEKLFWLNVNYRHPLMPELSDKYLARREVARRVGPTALSPLLGVWDDPLAIDFESLPN